MMVYVYLIAGALWVASTIGAFFYGEHVDNLGWVAAADQQKAEAAQKLTDLTTANAKLNTQIDEEHNAHVQDVQAQLDTNRKLLTHLDGLLHPKGSVGTGGNGKAIASGGPQGTTPPGQLPGSGANSLEILGDAFVNLARQADELADYANACHDWAISISQTTDDSK